MDDTTDGFEEAARIEEVYAEGEGDERVIGLLAEIVSDIRSRALNI
jgi:hypothetical protein